MRSYFLILAVGTLADLFWNTRRTYLRWHRDLCDLSFICTFLLFCSLLLSLFLRVATRRDLPVRETKWKARLICTNFTSSLFCVDKKLFGMKFIFTRQILIKQINNRVGSTWQNRNELLFIATPNRILHFTGNGSNVPRTDETFIS